MKNKVLFLIVSVAMLTTLIACLNQKPSVEKVLTKAEQDALTPELVIDALKEGNNRFVNGKLTVRDHTEQVRKSVKGQYPKAIILSCVDSRVPVEDVFDRGIGDLFVARVAGNFVNTDILGSMEFATKVAGAKLIMVLGHEHCGAIKAAIDNVQLGNISSLVKNISPAVEKSANFSGEKAAKNQDYVHEVCENNVKHTVEEIRKGSPIIRQLELDGKIRIVGAVYDMDNGKVKFL